MLSRTIVSSIALGLMSAGCATSSASPFADLVPTDLPPVIEVENRYFQEMSVTLVVSGKNFSLGEVPAFGTAQFLLPTEARGAAARVILKPNGDLKEIRTSLVRYSGAESLRLLIKSDPRQSELLVKQ